jgi:hypothetical protein
MINSLALSDLNKHPQKNAAFTDKTSIPDTEVDVVLNRELEIETLNSQIQKVEA